MKAMQKVQFTEGEEIIKEGDKGDKFYVVESGTCDISQKGKGSVHKATSGLAFGELALLLNQPRNATVTAECDVVVWQASRHPNPTPNANPCPHPHLCSRPRLRPHSHMHSRPH